MIPDYISGKEEMLYYLLKEPETFIVEHYPYIRSIFQQASDTVDIFYDDIKEYLHVHFAKSRTIKMYYVPKPLYEQYIQRLQLPNTTPDKIGTITINSPFDILMEKSNTDYCIDIEDIDYDNI